jgi:hypothetical protein
MATVRFRLGYECVSDRYFYEEVAQYRQDHCTRAGLAQYMSNKHLTVQLPIMKEVHLIS